MRISEISSLLGISEHTIRFYEKEGLVSPERTGEGAYRDYRSLDVIALMSCMRYRAFGYSLKEISALSGENSLEKRLHMQEALRRQLTAELDEKSRLLAFLNRNTEKLAALPLNAGRFWIAGRRAMLYASATDLFLSDNTVGEAAKSLMHRLVSAAPYVEGGVLLEQNGQGKPEWVFLMEAESASALGITPADIGASVLPEQLCLTTVVDIPDADALLTPAPYLPALREARKVPGMRQDGPLVANLLLRTVRDQRVHHYLEVQIPLAPG